jgi:hypothetical protein
MSPFLVQDSPIEGTVTMPRHSGITCYVDRDSTPVGSICTGTFWYTQQLYFQRALRLYISHGTDNIMTRYDTTRIEIPFGSFDVRIWVSHFLVQETLIERTPYQCPFRGIFAEPLN